MHLHTAGAALVRGSYEFPLSITTIAFGLMKAAPGPHTGSRAGSRLGSNAPPTASHRELMQSPLSRHETAQRGSPQRLSQRPSQHHSTALGTTRSPPPLSAVSGGCNSSFASLPNHAHAQTDLVGSPDLEGFAGGIAVSSIEECAARCAALSSADGWLKLRCQVWRGACNP